MNRSIRVVVASLLLAGCAADLKKTVAVTPVGESTGVAASTMVGPAGGTVRSADGKLELIVPAGALTEPAGAGPHRRGQLVLRGQLKVQQRRVEGSVLNGCPWVHVVTGCGTTRRAPKKCLR